MTISEKVVLDTHTLIWWINGGTELSSMAEEALDYYSNLESSMQVSVISAWEVAMLVSKERLVLTMDVHDWLAEIAKIPCIQFVPIEVDVAEASARLPGDFHKDPVDRLIVALAQSQNAPLITGDRKLLNYPHVDTIW